MKFRDDIDLENTYVVSDTHFGHDNIVPFCHRPGDHESVMMERWAQAVPDDATVLHLGDLTYKGARKFEKLIAPHLTGQRKLLIMGNHDTARYSLYRAAGFNIAQPFRLIVTNDNYGAFGPAGDLAIVPIPRSATEVEAYDICSELSSPYWVISFSHYQWEEKIGIPSDHVRVHGHIHNNGYFRDGFVPFLRNHINISVEQTKYRPVNLANLLSGYLLGTCQVADDDVQKGIEQTHER